MSSQPSFNGAGKRSGRPADLRTDRRRSEALQGLRPCITPRSVVVHPASDELRRALGPTPWMVLEELSLRSTGTADESVARVSIRAQSRTKAGIFDTGTYLIALPDSVTLVASALTATQPRARVGRRDSLQPSFAIES